MSFLGKPNLFKTLTKNKCAVVSDIIAIVVGMKTAALVRSQRMTEMESHELHTK